MEATASMSTASTMPAPCMTVDGVPVFPCALITPEAYQERWRVRLHGTRVHSEIYHWAHYVSTFIESDDGVEIEVSALVDVRPEHWASTVEDFLCRVAPEGPCVEIALSRAQLSNVEQRLIDEAVGLSR